MSWTLQEDVIPCLEGMAALAQVGFVNQMRVGVELADVCGRSGTGRCSKVLQRGDKVSGMQFTVQKALLRCTSAAH
jgi:hypothetical protein